MFITFPNVLVINESRAGNSIRQIGECRLRQEGVFATFARGQLRGFLFQPTDGGEAVLIIPRTKKIPDGHVRIVQATVNATTDVAD